MSDKEKAWTGKTGGTRGMQLSLIRIFRRVDQRWLYPLVWLWISGYILFAPATRRGCWYYWRHRQGLPPFKAAYHLWRNYLTFGKVILDRFACYAGRPADIRIEGGEILHQLEQRTEGFVVISSHIGNQELAGYSFRPQKPMHVLLYEGDTPTVNDRRRRTLESMGLQVIPMQPDGSHVLDMHNALSQGHSLSIHGDRFFYGGRTLLTPLLGEEAPFPEGPFRIAAAEGCPVISLFMMREGHGRYTLYVRQLSDGADYQSDRRQRPQELLVRYASAMEDMLARYPEQWFHFYDFWAKTPKPLR